MALLEWADRARRDLPWRSTRDPWAVLVSEVMLQQTQVGRVEPRFLEFLSRWPQPSALAASELEEVLRAWSGLGYPRRARNLRAAAALMVERHDGRVPRALDELLALPGVGPYTARAVLAFAHEDPVGVVDTNVGRILARWTGDRLSPQRAQLLADQVVPPDASWRWNQGLMDLGASLCRPHNPTCDLCPVRSWCSWAGDSSMPDPAVGSAATSRPQEAFEGSDRQARGRLLRALEAGPLPEAHAASAMEVDAARARRLVSDLRRDGLISARDETLYLGAGHLGEGSPN